MLLLVHFELVHGLIADLLEFALILLINLSLDVLPLVSGLGLVSQPLVRWKIVGLRDGQPWADKSLVLRAHNLWNGRNTLVSHHVCLFQVFLIDLRLGWLNHDFLGLRIGGLILIRILNSLVSWNLLLNIRSPVNRLLDWLSILLSHWNMWWRVINWLSRVSMLRCISLWLGHLLRLNVRLAWLGGVLRHRLPNLLRWLGKRRSGRLLVVNWLLLLRSLHLLWSVSNWPVLLRVVLLRSNWVSWLLVVNWLSIIILRLLGGLKIRSDCLLTWLSWELSTLHWSVSII